MEEVTGPKVLGVNMFNKELWDLKVRDQAIKAKALCTEAYTEYYIGQMLFKVDHALSHGRLAAAGIAKHAAEKTLTDNLFYIKVFGPEDTEEVKELKKLGEMLTKL